MRIDAIRGENIASLDGKFEINFQAEPLKSAGLFAITGPTGSGKSTLLDVICLALYDKTPRNDKGNSDKDDYLEGLSQQDTRHLLRRGTSEGYAEVEFLAINGSRYRSRWSVRRARGNVKGKLQSITLSLYNLTELKEEPGTKTETLKHIERLVGLSFDQFTRAVLLAQNDFSTFLKANENEKAELLEKLTGAEIYARISKQIFQRASEEKLKLQDMERSVAAFVLLDPEVLDEKKTQDLLIKKEISQTEAEVQLNQSKLKWLDELTLIRKEIESAQGKLDQAELSYNETGNLRSRLSLYDEMSPVRPLFIRNAEEQRKIDEWKVLVTDYRKQLQENEAVLLSEQEKKEKAEKRLTKIKEEDKSIAIEVNNMRLLDSQILQYTQEFTALKEKALKAAESLKAITASKLSLEKALHENNSLKQQSDAWLTEHAPFEPLIKKTDLLENSLSKFFEEKQDYDQLDKKIKALEVSKNNKENDLKTLSADYSKKEADLLLLDKSGHELQDEINKYSPEHLQRELSQLQNNIGAIDTLKNLTIRRTDKEKEYQYALQEYERAGKELEQAKKDKEDKAIRFRDVELKFNEARESYDLSLKLSAHSVESLRSELRDNEVCPVCGSLEHPFATNLDMAQKLESHLKTIYEQSYKLFHKEKEIYATADSRFVLLEAAMPKLTQNKERLLSEFKEADLQLKTETERSQFLKDQSGKNLDEVKNDLDNEYNKQTDKLNVYLELDKKLKNLTKGKEQLKNSAELIKQKKDQAERELNLILVEFESNKALKNDSRKRLAVLFKDIDTILAPYYPENSWIEIGEKLITDLSGLAKKWEENKQNELSLTKQIEEIQQNLALKAQALEQAESQSQELVSEMQEKELVLLKHKTERKACYEGRTVESVLSERADLYSNAEKILNDQKEITDKLSLNREKINGRIQQLNTEIANLEWQISENKIKLERWLSTYNASHESQLEDELYYEILNLKEQSVIENRNMVEQLRKDLIQTRLQMKMQQENMDNHLKKETKPDEEETADQLKGELNQLNAILEAKRKAHDTVRMELRMHEENLNKRGEIQKSIDKQIEICNNWLRVNEIFGSKEGDKFRKLAMGYTLDNLLLYANLHLNEISDRYQIKRSGDSLVLQVVDRYMANEVRSVISLSGGETFIVSLAMALGLSSIASNRVHIETLFIDEGFGALDPDTLQLAMTALRGLQHAGRKVGVISHVQEMTEQIATQINVQKKGNGRSVVCVS
ncbi:MAG: AAA family ATPase [Bacteroidales bacterium]